MYRSLEQREVICTIVLTLVTTYQNVFFILCRDLRAERGPLLADSFECFAGDTSQEYARKELCGKLSVLYNVERLLEHVKAGAH